MAAWTQHPGLYSAPALRPQQGRAELLQPAYSSAFASVFSSSVASLRVQAAHEESLGADRKSVV